MGRRGSQPQKDDERLENWRGEFSGAGSVSGETAIPLHQTGAHDLSVSCSCPSSSLDRY